MSRCTCINNEMAIVGRLFLWGERCCDTFEEKYDDTAKSMELREAFCIIFSEELYKYYGAKGKHFGPYDHNVNVVIQVMSDAQCHKYYSYRYRYRNDRSLTPTKENLGSPFVLILALSVVVGVHVLENLFSYQSQETINTPIQSSKQTQRTTKVYCL